MGQERRPQFIRGSSVDSGPHRKRWSLAESVEQVVNQYKLCQSLLELSRLPWAGPEAVDSMLWSPKWTMKSSLGASERSASVGATRTSTVAAVGRAASSATMTGSTPAGLQWSSIEQLTPRRSQSPSPTRSPKIPSTIEANALMETSLEHPADDEVNIQEVISNQHTPPIRTTPVIEVTKKNESLANKVLPNFNVLPNKIQMHTITSRNQKNRDINDVETNEEEVETSMEHETGQHRDSRSKQRKCLNWGGKQRRSEARKNYQNLQQQQRGVFTSRPPVFNHNTSSVPDRSPKSDAHKEVKMLAKATKALQEHVKDMTEKTRSTCSCVSKPSNNMKENILIQNQINNADPMHYIMDHVNGNTYVRGKLLGKGGFAKCYELKDVRTGKSYAGKIISKTRLTKPHQREKINREVELHKYLKNAHVVEFHSYFEDDDNVYIVLENCSRKSLVHVLRNRKTLTEPEVRYYMRHLVNGCKYIHSQHIVHRDLKLGNMLLNDNMNVKLADFGLATRLEYEGEKKMTVCGTPNYIAPEVLQKKGHSYEADVWAIGCIMYAMLVGRPPFETTTLKETYSRITSNKYSVPSHISLPAKSLIQKLLNPEPAHRPTLNEVLEHEFFSMGYTPKTLSSACCETMPKFTFTAPSSANRPKSYASPVSTGEAMFKIQSSIAQIKSPKTRSVASAPQPSTKLSSDLSPSHGSSMLLSTSSGRSSVRSALSPVPTSKSEPNVQSALTREAEPTSLPVGSAIRLYQMLATCMEQMPADAKPAPVHSVRPLWVTKWVDYSNKYGFGFQLSDKSVGVLFNDTTRMLLSTDGATIQYNDLSNKVYTFSSDQVPREYRKKSTLLLYFAQYMDEHLIHGGDILQHEKRPQDLPPPIFMKKWFRTSKAIVMYLNNGTLQVNFFEDHTKVILSPEGQDYLVTFINTHRQAVTYRLLQLRHFGCHPNIAQRLEYARSMMDSIINISGEAV